MEDGFDKMLRWLGKDREQAGKKYEEIRLRLIKFFARRGCATPEELADKTFDRVADKIEQLVEAYVGDPALYFYRVAQNIYFEYIKRKRPEPKPLPLADTSEEKEQRFACLDHCLEGLEDEQKDFILLYYQGEKGSKIEHRRQMAERLNVTIQTLRMRAHRIKVTLRKCVNGCLTKGEAA